MTLDKLDHKMTSFQVLVGKNQGERPEPIEVLDLVRCRATLAMIHLS